jgi:3'-phosphoadenosine 5'-phosphosulfate sulfotransferase (PAPS reductase)/FAD synthetase
MSYKGKKMERWQLQQRQNLPLDIKERLSIKRITDWYEKNDGNVYVSFSGGKDSTVLLQLVRSLYPNVQAVFCDTGLEYPEIREFVKIVDNVVWLKPEMNFKKVIEKYGYPVISKKIARMIRDLQNPSNKNRNTRQLYLTGIKQDGSISKYFKLPEKWKFLINAPFKISEKCCDIMKKNPLKKYERKTRNKSIIGTKAIDSQLREKSYLKIGCNNFKLGKSYPIAFWGNQDIWDYIKKYNIKYSKIYDMGEHNTGCMFCMFGVHLEKEPNRFQRMKLTHPKQYKYCMEDLDLENILNFIGIRHK